MKKREQLEKLQVLLTDTYRDSILEMQEIGEYNAALLNGARQLLKEDNFAGTSQQLISHTYSSRYETFLRSRS